MVKYTWYNQENSTFETAPLNIRTYIPEYFSVTTPELTASEPLMVIVSSFITKLIGSEIVLHTF